MNTDNDKLDFFLTINLVLPALLHLVWHLSVWALTELPLLVKL